MSYLICPKIGFLRYPGRTYTPPNELFAGEDDDMNQSICTEKPIFTEKPMLSLLQGNLHPDQQKTTMAPSWWPRQRATYGDCTDMSSARAADASVVKIGRGKAGHFESLWHGEMGSIPSGKIGWTPSSQADLFQVALSKVKIQEVPVLIRHLQLGVCPIGALGDGLGFGVDHVILSY